MEVDIPVDNDTPLARMVRGMIWRTLNDNSRWIESYQTSGGYSHGKGPQLCADL